MTRAAQLIHAFEQHLVEQDRRLRSSGSQWVKSGAAVAPATFLHTLDGLHAELKRYHRQASRLKSRDASDRQAQALLVQAFETGALAIHTLRVAAATTSPAAQKDGFHQAEALSKAARRLFSQARAAAG